MSGAIVSAGVLIAWAIYWGLSNVADAIRETKPNAATDEPKADTTEPEAKP